MVEIILNEMNNVSGDIYTILGYSAENSLRHVLKKKKYDNIIKSMDAYVLIIV